MATDPEAVQLSHFDKLTLIQKVAFDNLQRACQQVTGVEAASQSAAVLNVRLNRLEDCWAECAANHKEIYVLAFTQARGGHEYFKKSEYATHEAIYVAARDAGAILLGKHNQNNTPVLQQMEAREVSSMVQLQKINVPTFEGKITQWKSFQDTFNALIKNNTTLSDIAKFHYLKMSVRGEAKDLLDNLEITEANWPVAWKQLTDRYENKRLTVSAHLSQLCHAQSLKKESYKDMLNLRNMFHASVESLKNIIPPEKLFDAVMVYLLSECMSYGVKKDWELSIAHKVEPPTFDELDEYLLNRIKVLESLSGPEYEKNDIGEIKFTKSKLVDYKRVVGSTSKSVSAHHVTEPSASCYVCAGDHKIYSCTKFKELSVNQRLDQVRTLKLCMNCLGKNHMSKECKSTINCRKCNKRHNSLLHKDNSQNKNDKSNSVDEIAGSEASGREGSGVVNHIDVKNMHVLLATAIVWLRSEAGHMVQVRALVDPGSTWSFITRKTSIALGARYKNVVAPMTGLGGVSVGSASKSIQVNLLDSSKDPVVSVEALVVPQITAYTSSRSIDISQFNYLKNLPLADSFSTVDDIHMLLGADVYGAILLDGLKKGGPDEPVAQKTVFGWVVMGPCKLSSTVEEKSNATVYHVSADVVTHSLMKKFWELEKISNKKVQSPGDQFCEDHFVATHSRQVDGRYVVKIPFIMGQQERLGQSRKIAESQFLRIERKYRNKPEVWNLYVEFMKEYEDLNHMSKASGPPVGQSVYLPHHPVIRESSQTTKLRVVFNASSKTSSGVSLNDCTYAGPPLQSDLLIVLTQWRSYPHVFVSDIAKMYRQILVEKSDRDFQRILWRSSSDKQIEEYTLNTVTYGTRSAPFLALRVMKQLTVDEGKRYPLAVQVLTQDTFVDDLLFGAFSKEEAVKVRNEVIQLLAKAGLEARKWASNHCELVRDISSANHGLAIRASEEASGLKILGVRWQPEIDSFSYDVNLKCTGPVTKRKVLSTLFQSFDPAGWISPVIVKGKILMQQLWKEKISWDEELPQQIEQSWINLFESLLDVSKIIIPRWTKLHPKNSLNELHGFADASTQAYAAVVYLRTINVDGTIDVRLVVSKTRVAPIDVVSVHRLELEAALLLAKLIETLRCVRAFKDLTVHCWTDSAITLAWLSKHASSWKLFVSNRVAAIHEILPNQKWKHVVSECNPADLPSRGCAAADIVNNSLWWFGPDWLSKMEEDWPSSVPNQVERGQLEAKIHLVDFTPKYDRFVNLLNSSSNWVRLTHVVAYCYRFFNIKKAVKPANIYVITAEEVNKATIFIFRMLQSSMFQSELKALSLNQTISPKSTLKSLNAFIEKETGLIRVGGRLENAELSYTAKHPIALLDHNAVRAFIRYIHTKCLHGGLKLTLNTLRQSVWIVRSRSIVKSVIHNCILCAKRNAKLMHQIMANLPQVRVSQVQRAFVHTGVDYAGPFQVRMAGGRGQRTYSCYLSVFVCLSVKAVHLELVSNYTSEAFIAAFKRFVSRRGLPTCMYSDRGTNFGGAARKLHESFLEIIESEKVQAFVSNDKVQWKFNPPAAPHFGGMWEAGVKSVKTHLKKLITDISLTYEEFSTVLCQIEAVLNSRPIEPLTDHVDDLDPLTPGHFLIGGPLNAVPQISLLKVNGNCLSRWLKLQQISQGFWERWSRDYLQSLQQRNKWQKLQPNVKEGQLVLLRMPNMPIGKWLTARIIKCYESADGNVRVVRVKTANSEYDRPITEIALLPLHNDSNQN